MLIKLYYLQTGLVFLPSFRQPFVIHDMETVLLAEQMVMAKLVGGGGGGGGVGPDGAGSGPEELQEREAEARLFHCSQCFSVETVTELTEFAKSVPGFQCLDLNDQMGDQFKDFVELYVCAMCGSCCVYCIIFLVKCLLLFYG